MICLGTGLIRCAGPSRLEADSRHHQHQGDQQLVAGPEPAALTNIRQALLPMRRRPSTCCWPALSPDDHPSVLFTLLPMVLVLALLAVAFERQTLTSRCRRAKSAVWGSVNRSNSGSASSGSASNQPCSTLHGQRKSLGIDSKGHGGVAPDLPRDLIEQHDREGTGRFSAPGARSAPAALGSAHPSLPRAPRYWMGSTSPIHSIEHRCRS